MDFIAIAIFDKEFKKLFKKYKTLGKFARGRLCYTFF